MNILERHEERCGNDLTQAQSMRDFCFSSLAGMRLMVCCCALFAISLHALFMVPTALAATWPVPTSALSASTAFHESYSAGKDSYVHSGLDIPASAGMQISAPLAGKVRFAGSVPSGDSRLSGSSPQRTMLAVSIELSNGRIITLMPFDAIHVREGQMVSEQASLGTLAASGDISSASTHLHMGYKQGALYLDPMQLFAASSPSSGEQGAEATGADSASARLGTETALLAGEPAAGLAYSNAFQGQVTEESEALGEVPIEEPVFRNVETGDFVLRQKAQTSPTLLERVSDAAASLLSACGMQLDALADAAETAAQNLHIPLPLLLGSTVAVFCGAAVFLGTACAKRLAPSIRQFAQARKCSASTRLT